MAKGYLVWVLLLLGVVGCSESDQVKLEFRLAEEEPAPGLSEIAFEPTGQRFYLHREVLLNQTDVDSAIAILRDGSWQVELIFTSPGAQKFAELTEQNVNKRCGMVLDGRLLSAPLIRAPITSGRALITNDFTKAEAQRIVQGLLRR